MERVQTLSQAALLGNVTSHIRVMYITPTFICHEVSYVYIYDLILSILGLLVKLINYITFVVYLDLVNPDNPFVTNNPSGE